MSLREQKKSSGLDWRKANRADLLGAGMPEELIEDDTRWRETLFRGADLVSGWQPSQITKAQAGRLLGLLRARYPISGGMGLFDALEKRIKGK
jgi:hypothetical protein